MPVTGVQTCAFRSPRATQATVSSSTRHPWPSWLPSSKTAAALNVTAPTPLIGSIISSPELQIYVKHFGESKDDWGLAAEVDGKIVGAVWVRIMNDYGHIDDKTPSLAISLYKEYRGFGIGTAMMKEILTLLKSHGYSRVSLSVQKANYAAKMYLKIGFEIVRENEEEYIMVNYL